MPQRASKPTAPRTGKPRPAASTTDHSSTTGPPANAKPLRLSANAKPQRLCVDTKSQLLSTDAKPQPEDEDDEELKKCQEELKKCQKELVACQLTCEMLRHLNHDANDRVKTLQGKLEASNNKLEPLSKVRMFLRLQHWHMLTRQELNELRIQLSTTQADALAMFESHQRQMIHVRELESAARDNLALIDDLQVKASSLESVITHLQTAICPELECIVCRDNYGALVHPVTHTEKTEAKHARNADGPLSSLLNVCR
ncbi:hypothetical protein CYLTODRAFT_412681 [Cylindrobasidium torrendii FP15055 ss-10]|uniref:Uncharacterized protein n=1 Tax=Cylindrobasidium torrendii FP15055 ss-10 TaxID=1314674 RepID=A0A0D7B563_9AGAR|nr:hypothetical protein CYLTODRAFT_412681 [Cylindrobasidium torrendii FP15055 ss-10]